MIIGIDIDDTLTDIKDKLNLAAINYAKNLGKTFDNNINEINDSSNDGNVYQEKFGFTYDELKYFLKDIQESITSNALPRENVVNIIKRLKKDGHTIVIITARDSEFHDDPYTQSKIWLDNNNIYYDKIIVNARDKSIACKEENIDLFIDDSLSNCIKVSNLDIDTIRISNNLTIKSNITTFNNWNDIYNYIKTKYKIK